MLPRAEEQHSSKRKLGRGFSGVILHVSMLEQHRRCVDIWLKAKKLRARVRNFFMLKNWFEGEDKEKATLKCTNDTI